MPCMTLIGIHFPTIPFKKMCNIIQCPELWTTGGGMMAGVPSFKLDSVTGPFSIHKETMVSFNVRDHKIRLVGKSVDRSTLTIANRDDELAHTTIISKANAVGKTGSHLVLNIDTRFPLEETLLKMAIETGIKSLPDISVMEQHPTLKKYRENLEIFPNPDQCKL